MWPKLCVYLLAVFKGDSYYIANYIATVSFYCKYITSNQSNGVSDGGL